MLGLALFFALALDTLPGPGLEGASACSSSCRTPCPPWSRRSCGATSTAPTSARSPRSRARSGFGTPDFLSPENILGSMMNIVTWEFIGYNMIIMYAALRSIPSELYEAAEIDGAGQFRLAWSVKIPAIRPAIMLTVIFSIIGSFQLFAEPSLLDAHRAERDHELVHAELLRLQPRVHQPGAQLRGRHRVPPRNRDRGDLVHRPARIRTKRAPRDEGAVMTATETRTLVDRRRPTGRRRGRAATTTRRGGAACCSPCCSGCACSTSCSRCGGCSSRRRRTTPRCSRRSACGSAATSRSGRTCRRCSPSATASSRAGCSTPSCTRSARRSARRCSPTMAGYAFAKYEFPGKKVLFSATLGAVMIPLTALALPTYLLFSQAGLTDTPWAVIIPSLVSPFGVYLMRVYAADAIPDTPHRGGARRRRRRVPHLLAGGTAAARAGPRHGVPVLAGRDVEQLLPAADHAEQLRPVPDHGGSRAAAGGGVSRAAARRRCSRR